MLEDHRTSIVQSSHFVFVFCLFVLSQALSLALQPFGVEELGFALAQYCLVNNLGVCIIVLEQHFLWYLVICSEFVSFLKKAICCSPAMFGGAELDVFVSHLES